MLCDQSDRSCLTESLFERHETFVVSIAGQRDHAVPTLKVMRETTIQTPIYIYIHIFVQLPRDYFIKTQIKCIA